MENGGLDIDGSPLEGLGYQNGTTALYTCAQDHHLDPRGSTGRRICINGAWTGIQVGCGKQNKNPIIDISITALVCFSVKNGGCSLDGTLVNGYSIEEKGSMHRVRYGCQHGYQIEGPEERKCSGGVWMPPYMPKCVKKTYQGEYTPSCIIMMKNRE